MANNIDVQMGINLRGLRALSGLSQTELGAKCRDGLSAQQISKYELGESQISCARLVEFAAIFKCGLLNFFKGVQKNG